MKKFILLAAMSLAGLVSAKNGEEKKETKTDEKEAVAKAQCQLVGMFIWCTGEVVEDTICWGSGTNNATYADATAEETHNSQLLSEYTCGAGTGSGW